MTTETQHTRTSWLRDNPWVSWVVLTILVGACVLQLLFGHTPWLGLIWLPNALLLLSVMHLPPVPWLHVEYHWTHSVSRWALLPMVPGFTWGVAWFQDMEPWGCVGVAGATVLVMIPFLIKDLKHQKNKIKVAERQFLDRLAYVTGKDELDNWLKSFGHMEDYSQAHTDLVTSWLHLDIPVRRKSQLMRAGIQPQDALTPDVVALGSDELAAMIALQEMSSGQSAEWLVR